MKNSTAIKLILFTLIGLFIGYIAVQYLKGVVLFEKINTLAMN